MSILDEIRRTKTPKLITSRIWLNMLIEYDTHGNAKILRSYSNPAKDTDIKRTVKEKKKDAEKIKINEPSNTAEDLFG